MPRVLNPKDPKEKGKLRRMRVWQEISGLSIDDLEGPVVEVMERLQKMCMDATLAKWKDVEFRHESNYDEGWYELWGTRMETNAEMHYRFGNIRRRKARAKEKKAAEAAISEVRRKAKSKEGGK